MSWLVRQVAGIEERISGRKTGAIIGMNGKSVATGLTIENARAMVDKLNETEPDNIYVIVQEDER